MLIKPTINDINLQLLRVPMRAYEIIIMGMGNHTISYNDPMIPMKMRFFKIAATSVLKEGKTGKGNTFIIYLILMGLMGIMGFCNIIQCLKFPLNNQSWDFMGYHYLSPTVAPIRRQSVESSSGNGKGTSEGLNVDVHNSYLYKL